MFRLTPRLHLPHGHILEVERKFAPTPTSISLLARNAGHPAFPLHVAQPSLVFEDTYFDRDDVLQKQGVYIRRRRYLDPDQDQSSLQPATGGHFGTAEIPGKSENWEAKLRISGDFTRSAFQEIQGVEEVTRLVYERFPKHHQHHQHSPTPVPKVEYGAGTLGCDFLEILARFVTRRRQWLVNERFHVVIDKADFGHVVGEVEVVQREAEEEEEEDGIMDKHVAKSLDAEIEEFMERYAWAFPTGQVKGKLSAYFEWKKKQKVEGGK